MRRVKITVRLTPTVAAALAKRARGSRRGISNTVEAMLCQVLRLPSPRPDHPRAHDDRYTARPRKG
jgi:hypothetical protein